MDVANIDKATAWFEVLQTGERSQAAMMKLKSGGATGEKAEQSDQVC